MVTDSKQARPLMTQPQLDLGIRTPKRRRPNTKKHPAGGELPAWIADQLTANKSKPAPRYRTEHHYCRTCKEIIITGTYDLAAKPGRTFMHATIDPTPLDPDSELACLLAGRTTYRCQTTPRSITIIESRIARWEMGWHINEIVLPAHQCGARFDGFHTPPAPERTITNDPDGINF